MKHHLSLLSAGILLAGSLGATVIPLYDSFTDPGTIGFSFIKTGTNFGDTWGVAITGDTPMQGHIAGLRIWSAEFGSYSRADATHRLAENITTGFRVSWKAHNQNYFWVSSGKRKVALRAANQSVAEDVINSSSSNYQNLVEMFTDGTVSGAWTRMEDGTGAGGYVSDEGGGVGPDPIALSTHAFDLVVNGSNTETFTYVLHSTKRTLHPMGIDLFVDGKLVTNPETPNGGYIENKSGFDPAQGFGTFSFTTATASHAETDFVLDQIYIRTGDDVNDGTTAVDRPIDVLIGMSYPWGFDWFYHPLLLSYWSQGQHDWIYTRSGWFYLGSAGASAMYAYSVSQADWLYIPSASPNYVYMYTANSWYYWTPVGEFLKI